MRNLTQSFTHKWPSSWFFRTGRLSLLAFLLAGCAAGPPSDQLAQMEGIATDTTELEQMASEGRFLDAALAYSKLATDAKSAPAVSPDLQQHYALRAAELLMSGNYVPQAYQLLNEIDATHLDSALQIRHTLLSANIALTRQLPDEAQNKLNQAEQFLTEADETEPDTVLRFRQLRAQTFAQLGNHIEVAREHVLMEVLLTEPETILANQEAIIVALQALSPVAIQSLLSSGSTDALGGWLALVNIGHSMDDPQQAGADVVRWRERFPEHPALDTVIATVLAARPRVLRLPKKSPSSCH